MLTIHHLGVSQSERIIWLCEEYGVPYELKLYERDPQTRLAPEAYKALHPIGTAPVITDGDLVLGETGAIIEYLLTHYAPGKGRPSPDDPGYAEFLFWYHYIGGSFMPSGMIRMVTNLAGDAMPAAAREGLSGRYTRGIAMIEKRLGESKWLGGDSFTVADIMVTFCLTTARYFIPQDLSGFPNILAYLKRVSAMDSYQRTMKLGDPDMTLLLD